MKKAISILLLVILSISLYMTGCNATDGVSVKIDGRKIAFDVPPQIINNRTLVPIRKIAEELKLKVQWYADERKAEFKNDRITIVVYIDNKIATVNGKEITLDVPAMIVDGRTMVPVRFISESMGVSVSWEDATKTVVITNIGDGQQFYIEFPTVPSFGYISGITSKRSQLEKGIALAYNIANLQDGKINEYRDLLKSNGFEYKGTSSNRENYLKGDITVSMFIGGDPLSLFLYITKK